MSTVSDIYSTLQYRPDLQVNSDDLIHLVNAAIRAVSKRLYVLDSDLITAQMEVPIYAEVSYTASLAFVDSNPDTITDALSAFVTEGFDTDMPITTTHASNAGPFRISTVVAGTLTLVSTDAVVAAGASSITITSDDAYGFLPSDFWGIRQRFEPYLDTYTVPLIPLPNQAVSMQYQSAGVPKYYKLQGTSRIYVTPHAGADYTIISDYYQRPAAVTGDTSTIPWNELFDDLIAEFVEIGFRGAQNKSGNTVQILDKLIRDGVDMVVSRYDRKAPVIAPQAIQW